MQHGDEKVRVVLQQVSYFLICYTAFMWMRDTSCLGMKLVKHPGATFNDKAQSVAPIMALFSRASYNKQRTLNGR